jgi:hypothetical protein
MDTKHLKDLLFVIIWLALAIYFSSLTIRPLQFSLASRSPSCVAVQQTRQCRPRPLPDGGARTAHAFHTGLIEIRTFLLLLMTGFLFVSWNDKSLHGLGLLRSSSRVLMEDSDAGYPN